jgi:hypothetical protein
MLVLKLFELVDGLFQANLAFCTLLFRLFFLLDDVGQLAAPVFRVAQNRVHRGLAKLAWVGRNAYPQLKYIKHC